MNSRKTPEKLTLMTANPFKGLSSLVLRKLLTTPSKEWTGTVLAKKLEMSPAWVNRIIGTLEFERFIERTGRGPKDKIILSNPKKLLDRWCHFYNFHLNQYHLYLYQKKDPIKSLVKLKNKYNFHLALTGLEAANKIKKVAHHVVPMVYLWPVSNQDKDFKKILRDFENIENLIPVTKKANLIILKPHQKSHVFFESKKIKNYPIVNPLQLYLDLQIFDQSEFVLNELRDYFKEENMSYV